MASMSKISILPKLKTYPPCPKFQFCPFSDLSSMSKISILPVFRPLLHVQNVNYNSCFRTFLYIGYILQLKNKFFPKLLFGMSLHLSGRLSKNYIFFCELFRVQIPLWPTLCCGGVFLRLIREILLTTM